VFSQKWNAAVWSPDQWHQYVQSNLYSSFNHYCYVQIKIKIPVICCFTVTLNQIRGCELFSLFLPPLVFSQKWNAVVWSPTNDIKTGNNFFFSDNNLRIAGGKSKKNTVIILLINLQNKFHLSFYKILKAGYRKMTGFNFHGESF
jgi:hypothetical protein